MHVRLGRTISISVYLEHHQILFGVLNGHIVQLAIVCNQSYFIILFVSHRIDFHFSNRLANIITAFFDDKNLVRGVNNDVAMNLVIFVAIELHLVALILQALMVEGQVIIYGILILRQVLLLFTRPQLLLLQDVLVLRSLGDDMEPKGASLFVSKNRDSVRSIVLDEALQSEGTLY